METPNESKAPPASNLLSRLRHCFSHLKIALLGFTVAFGTALIIMGTVDTVDLLSSKQAIDEVHITDAPPVIMDLRDPMLEGYAPMWQIEVGRRFSNSVVILCHGGGIVENEWVIQDNPLGSYGTTCEKIDDVLNKERAEFPTRTIVVLSCNPCHLVVHGHPNCFYSPSSVWCIPDRNIASAEENDAKIHQQIDGPNEADDDSPAPVVRVDRSVADPETVGNIFEFIEAK